MLEEQKGSSSEPREQGGIQGPYSSWHEVSVILKLTWEDVKRF